MTSPRGADRASHEGTASTIRAQVAAGETWLAGVRPGALDVYVATFLTPLSDIPETDCPGLAPTLRHAFASAHEELGHLVPAELVAHRRRMFERHLAWPIEL